jgi:hypothetical protein
MAMSLSPASDAILAPSTQHGGVDNSNNSLSNSSLPLSNHSSSNSISNDPTTNSMNDHQIPPSSGVKRKPSRRANTAERRATHNAVERQRRETLNGRFLDLAALLPNLSQIRRPSKSSIVNSSIAHIQASRRHRLIASRELKMLKHEADALRREANEWRDRSGLPRVEEPVRGDAFGMVIAAELEVIQGIAIEEEDEDAEDGYGAGLPVGNMPSVAHHTQQQVQAYTPTFVDDVEDEVTMLGAMYAQQQNGRIHPVHLNTQHQILPQHPMMAPQAQDLEDPRMTAMLLKNADSFAYNASQPTVPSTGYPTLNTRSTTYSNGPANWVPSQVTAFAPGHLYTPPPSAHTLSGNTSVSGSPVGGESANGGSPASTTSSLSSMGSVSPISMVPSHHSLGMHRERSNSLTGTNSSGQSPPYELHHGAMQDLSGVPRMGGMGGGPAFVPSHHHMHGQGLGMQIQPQTVGFGGGANAVMMMMM